MNRCQCDPLSDTKQHEMKFSFDPFRVQDAAKSITIN